MQVNLPIAIKEEALAAFPHSALLIVGCTSTGINRRYCEVDIMAFPAKGNVRLFNKNGQFYRIIPSEEKTTLLLNDIKLVEDEMMIVAGLLSGFTGHRINKARRAKSLLLMDEAIEFHTLALTALKAQEYEVTTLYFIASILRFSESIVFARGEVSHPSHLADQLRKTDLYREVTGLLDFDLATASNVRRRILKLSQIIKEDNLVILTRKMEGMVNDGKVFDALFYSFWAISALLRKNILADRVLADALRVGVEANELRRRVDWLSTLLKNNLGR
ncbi:MAG: hypothetical protein QXR69_03680 [Conexivisphaerales archaeon]